MWGIEMQADVRQILRKGQTMGMLMGNAGEHVLRLLPPLTIGQEDITQAIDKLHQIFEELAS